MPNPRDRFSRGAFAFLPPLAAAAFLAAATPALVDAADGTEAAPRIIRTSGTATVRATPDRVRVAVSMISRAQTARAASEENARLSKAVLDKLRAAVRVPGEVRTAGYDLSPEYDYGDGSGRKGPRLIGYVATNRLFVVTDDLTGVGALLDAAVGAGANQVDSISFFLDDEQAARRQALLEAGRRARAEAETIAESLGVALGDLLDASSGTTHAPPPVYGHQRAMMAMAEDASTEIAPGTMELGATVQVTFGIR